MSLVIPMALFRPELIEAGVLIIAPLVIGIHDRLSNLLGAHHLASHLDLLADAGDHSHLRHLRSKRSCRRIVRDS